MMWNINPNNLHIGYFQFETCLNTGESISSSMSQPSRHQTRITFARNSLAHWSVNSSLGYLNCHTGWRSTSSVRSRPDTSKRCCTHASHPTKYAWCKWWLCRQKSLRCGNFSNFSSDWLPANTKWLSRTFANPTPVLPEVISVIVPPVNR